MYTSELYAKYGKSLRVNDYYNPKDASVVNQETQQPYQVRATSVVW